MIIKRIRIFALVMFLGVGTVAFSVNSSSAQQSSSGGSDDEVNSELIDVAREANQLVPLIVDGTTRFDAVIAGDRELLYYTTLLGYSTATLTAQKAEVYFRLRSFLIDFLCPNEFAYGLMSQYDVTYVYHLYGNDDQYFLSIPIAESDCSYSGD